jgi:hypothetical protein
MKKQRTHTALPLLAGIGVGAALMFFLDPQRGSARRAEARARPERKLRAAKWELETARRDLRNRARGVAAGLRSRLGAHDAPDDLIVVERVRAELGHHVDSLHGVDVTAADGVVTLHGNVLARDRKEVVSAAASVQGVRRVQDELIEKAE